MLYYPPVPFLKPTIADKNAHSAVPYLLLTIANT